jgi:hypothetical protein
VNVRVAGASSWRFEHDDLDILPVAPFIRDAARLPVDASADVPPPLTGEVPDASAVLSPADRRVAAGQWLAWWRRMLDQAVREVRIRRARGRRIRLVLAFRPRPAASSGAIATGAADQDQ